MAQFRKQPGTPVYHNLSARKGPQAKPSVTRTMRIPAEIERENQMQWFKLGLMIGFLAAAIIFCIILFLWVIPTMDAAVQTAQEMVS